MATARPRNIVLSLLAAVAVLAALEGGVRIAQRLKGQEQVAPTPAAMMQALPRSRIAGREIGNQMLVHNIALMARHPDPASVTTAYVGTSRTKVLRPHWFGIEGAVNAANNSYNEISYGSLLQLEALRLQFPHLRTVFVESSLLLRRPMRLILEEDHRKYLPLLESVLPLRAGLPGAGDEFTRQVAAARAAGRRAHRSALRGERQHLRLVNLLGFGDEHAAIPVLQDQWLSTLRFDGERTAVSERAVARVDQRPEAGREHVKVQRLRDIPSWQPWDGLFDMVARWGRQHGIQVVFFQPAVRSDLHRFQVEYGLAMHVADLKRISVEYKVPFVDFNLPELGYMGDWSLFADEDHMETCTGVVLLHAGLDDGLRRFRERGELLPLPVRQDLERKYADRLQRCPAALPRPSAAGAARG